MEQLETIGRVAEGSMVYTMIIPFCFMIFLKASMNRVWSFYNMLQLASNIKNYSTLFIPSNVKFMLDLLESITFFKIFSSKPVKDFFNKYIFKNAKIVTEIIVGQGVLV